MEPSKQKDSMFSRPSNRPTVAAVESCRKRLKKYHDDLRDQPTQKFITDWMDFVSEYYSPTAKKSWCFSSYDIYEPYPLMNTDSWHCEICKTETGYGLELKVGAIARFFKLKYATMKAINEYSTFGGESATLSPDGNIILDFKRVSEETEYNQFYVVHQGTCRIKFAADLKILSWEFCCQSHKILDSQRDRETNCQWTQQLYRINELGFAHYFLRKLEKFQHYRKMDSAYNQVILQEENPADGQVVPQNDNPAPEDDQNEDTGTFTFEYL